ncbi:hypothetical protein WMF19_18495 [Sorangium sp. So ce124]
MRPLGVDQHVVRLDIAVQEAAPVHLAQAARERGAQAQRDPDGEWALVEHAGERGAIPVLQHERRLPIVLFEAQGPDDPGDIERAQHGVLMLELLPRARARRLPERQLEHHLAAGRGVGGSHDAHVRSGVQDLAENVLHGERFSIMTRRASCSIVYELARAKALDGLART